MDSKYAAKQSLDNSVVSLRKFRIEKLKKLHQEGKLSSRIDRLVHSEAGYQRLLASIQEDRVSKHTQKGLANEVIN